MEVAPNQGNGYTIRGAYQLLTHQEDHHLDTVLDIIWHKQVPLNVSICAWCLLQNRLPTKDNLVRRDIISLDYHHCISGCGQIESSQHLFIH